MDKQGRYTIDDLVELTGFQRRTIRFYVERGLLDPPAGRGRGGFYDEGQLARLRDIAQAREEGRSLAAIAASFAQADLGPDSGPALRAPGLRGARTEAVDADAKPPAPDKRVLRWELAPGMALEVDEESRGANSGLARAIINLAIEWSGAE